MIRAAERVAVLTGAGVSAESDVPTFRAPADCGKATASTKLLHRSPFSAIPFWSGVSIICVGPTSAASGPIRDIRRWWHWKRNSARSDSPSSRKTWTACTGPPAVGMSWNCTAICAVRCTGCGRIEDRDGETLADLPRCECGALLRPDIVRFHEMLPADVRQAAESAASACQCLLVAGTSAVVYPAAGLIDIAQGGSARVIEVNLDRTEASRRVDLGLYGPSGEILPRLVEKIQASRGA